MTQREQARLQVLNSLLAEHMTPDQAATLMGVSSRHARRTTSCLMQGLLRRCGIPLALYADRHPVFKHRSEYQSAGTPTQFGRAMEELGIQLIFALSPQAKGRVERTAGTF